MMKHKTKLMGISLATLMLVSVIAMTGVVSAAPTVKAVSGSAEAVWATAAGTYGGTIVSSTDGKVYCTATAAAATPAWTTIGKPTGTIQSDPSAVVGPGGLYVFVSTTDGKIWEKEVNPAGFATINDWAQVGTAICAAGTGPGAVATTIGGTPTVGLFYVGTQNELEYTYQPGGGASLWSAPQNLAGYVSASPGACSRGPDSIDVFARGQSGGLWSRDYATGGFGGWYQVPGFGYLAPGSGPAAIVDSPTTMFVFVEGGSGQLYYQRYDPTLPNQIGGWNIAVDGFGNPSALTGYTQVSSTLTGTPGAAFIALDIGKKVSVFVRGGDNNLWYNLGSDAYPIVFSGWVGPINNMP